MGVAGGLPEFGGHSPGLTGALPSLRSSHLHVALESQGPEGWDLATSSALPRPEGGITAVPAWG